MHQESKLYEILEKVNVEMKIGLEIQNWMEDTLEKRQKISMFQFQETKLLPMHKDLKQEIQAVRSDLKFEIDSVRTDLKHEIDTLRTEVKHEINKFRTEVKHEISSLRTEMHFRFESIDARFTSLEKRLDATNFSICLLGVPIVGATIGGLGVVFLQIWERLQ